MDAKLKSNSWWIGLALAGIVICGCSDQPQASKQALPPTDAEKTVAPSPDSKPTIPEKATTNGRAKSDPAKQTSDRVSTPANPIDAVKFPKPQNAGKPMYNSETRTVMFHQAGKVEDQARFYVEELGKLGWKKEASSEISDGVGFFDFTSGTLSITVTINPSGDDKITTIAQGSGISVPESLDEVGDDDAGDGN